MMNKSHKTLALPGVVFSRPGVVFALLGLVLLTGAATLFATPLEVGTNAKPAPATQDSNGFESLEAQIGYSVGVNMGRSMAAYDVQVDIEALLQGVRDGLSGAATKMSEAEMRGVLARMQQGAATKRQQHMTELGKKNRIEGPNFLDTNKTKEGVIETTSGLQYKVLQEGSGESPKSSDKVRVHYTGTTIDGTKFDSSRDRGTPAVFAANRVIKGWTEGLQLMKVGSRFQFFIPSHLAYGLKPPPQTNFGPDAVLLFDVELLEIVK